MELSYELEKMFPTEESRFDAYKKWLIISAVFQPFFLLDFPEVLELLRLVPQLYFINFINLGRLLRSLQISSVVTLISIVSSCIGIYIYWKSNIIKTLLKMSLGMLFGVVVMIIIERSCPLPPFIVPIVCLFINWNRLKEYRKGNERFIKDGLMLIGMISVSAVIVSSLVSVYYLVPDHAINIRRIVLIMVIELVIFISFPIYLIRVFNRERALGNTFANAYNQLTITTFFIIFSFTALTTLLSHNLFNGDRIVDDIKRAFSNSKAVRAERAPFMHNTDVDHTNTSAGDTHVGLDNTYPGMNSYIDGASYHSGLDLMDENFMHVYGGTNMADISNIQHHPYMIFNDPSVQGNFQVCDPNGMPQMTISNGNIVDSEYKVIGHVDTDAISGTTTYKDINHNSILSIDSHRQMFSGNHYIGHMDTSGDVTVMRDMNNNIVARYDKLTHTWFDKMSKPISQIKMM